MFIKKAKFTLKVGAGSALPFQGEAADVHVEVTAGDTVDYPTLDGNVQSNAEAETYALVLRAGQNYGTGGLARFLWDNKGAVLDVEVNAFGDTATAGPTTPSITGQVHAIPVQYGGEVSTFAEFEVTLPFLTTPLLDITP
jgi:hypothetical protein